MKHTQPKYNPVLADLYSRAKKELQLAHQWKNRDSVEFASNYTIYMAKASALIELLESVTVFHVGGGYDQIFLRPLNERLNSFKELITHAK